jgi:hypothetical protein
MRTNPSEKELWAGVSKLTTDMVKDLNGANDDY